ncbi:hypothetical protein D4764_14G0008100 [Takifugu flavidus]|uniref:Leucine-rich repeat and calponin-like proteiny domain-containing protein 2 n=1 Tax=Takifugu flavidus TaxID=433684 RepID=A0A5C6P9G2_9TELE|nr:hypothetical protein D4764_14G0008100 [Takifugu flavidus]
MRQMYTELDYNVMLPVPKQCIHSVRQEEGIQADEAVKPRLVVPRDSCGSSEGTGRRIGGPLCAADGAWPWPKEEGGGRRSRFHRLTAPIDPGWSCCQRRIPKLRREQRYVIKVYVDWTSNVSVRETCRIITAISQDLPEQLPHLSSLANLSKNRFTEIPPEVCLFAPLESLNLYHNCIKCIPEAIINLQMLTYLDISRNLLSVLPKYLFNLPLKVLLVSNNKLLSIPEEIGKAKDLMELDVSCNEIQALPAQVGRLQALRELNIRRNCLHMLPEELADLPLIRLDFSCNKITEIPAAYRKLRQLQHIILDNNPMQSPPAQASSFTT